MLGLVQPRSAAAVSRGDDRGVVGEGAVGDGAVEGGDIGDREEVEVEAGVGERLPRSRAQRSARARGPRRHVELASARAAGRGGRGVAALLRGGDQGRDPTACACCVAQLRDQLELARAGPVLGADQDAADLAFARVVEDGAPVASGALEAQQQDLVDLSSASSARSTRSRTRRDSPPARLGSSAPLPARRRRMRNEAAASAGDRARPRVPRAAAADLDARREGRLGSSISADDRILRTMPREQR